MIEPERFLRDLFSAALEAADPFRQLPAHLPAQPPGRVLVLGAGKASARMAQALEHFWPEAHLEGLIVTRYGHAVPCKRIEIVEAAHPVPDAAGQAAARRVLELAQAAGADDMVIVLISGGGSSLLALPAEGLSLAEKQHISAALLKSGASITEMNCVRKQLSAIKGGRLAAAIHPARSLTLLISDVPGDDPAVIASGPTIGDDTTPAEALAILERYGIESSPEVRRRLSSDRAGSLGRGDPRLAGAEWRMIATPALSLQAAADLARASGFEAIVLGDDVEGEARGVGADHARLALGLNPARPTVLLSGGETSVRVTGSGRGGRNVEYLLSLALHLDGAAGIHALAADTDGIDGIEEIAGAVIAPDTLAHAAATGLDARDHLDRNDAHSFFEALGDQVVTGPTLTNVNDFRALLVLPQDDEGK